MNSAITTASTLPWVTLRARLNFAAATLAEARGIGGAASDCDFSRAPPGTAAARAFDDVLATLSAVLCRPTEADLERPAAVWVVERALHAMIEGMPLAHRRALGDLARGGGVLRTAAHTALVPYGLAFGGGRTVSLTPLGLAVWEVAGRQGTEATAEAAP